MSVADETRGALKREAYGEDVLWEDEAPRPLGEASGLAGDACGARSRGRRRSQRSVARGEGLGACRKHACPEGGVQAVGQMPTDKAIGGDGASNYSGITRLVSAFSMVNPHPYGMSAHLQVG